MSFKSKLLATAAVISMAAAAIYGSTLEMSGIEEEGSRLSWFGKDKETIYFWYSDESLTNYINSAAVSFGEKEGVRVIPILTSDSEYLEAINRDTLHSEQIPDAYLISNDSLEKAYLAGLACEIIDEEGLCSEENFPKAALDAVSYEDKTIAYPIFYETSALVYNQTYLDMWVTQQTEKQTVSEQESVNEGSDESSEGAQLDAEEVAVNEELYLENAVPATIDDILTIANTFDLPEGIEGIMKWDVSDIFYNYWIVGEYMIVGGDAGDSREDTSIYNEETIQCLEVYKALNQFFFIESDTVTYDSVVQDFMDGKLVFTIGTTDIIKRLEEAKKEGSFAYEYGIAQMPDVNSALQSRSLSVTNAVAINGFSQNKELANEFAAYLANDYADNLYERTGKVSANCHAETDNWQLQGFYQEYADSVSLPKMMETGNFWLQLEILFSKVWNGEDVTALVQELAVNMNVLLNGAPQ
ncbi:MAG: extracellular solute-binding protein [Lachnospiraceae bacterium]|nr:extracellular solute-binding protein [Lachnospiraceae bacterium]